MNYIEAKSFINDTFAPLIRDRFEEIYPDTFVKCNTIDEDEYKQANGSMYSHYISIVNGLFELPETPGKYVREYGTNSDFKYIKQMYEDFKNTDTPMRWLIEHVAVR